MICKVSSCGQGRLKSDCAYAQADLNLRWAYMLDCTFSHRTALILKVTFEPAHDKIYKMACAPSEDSDQPGHPPSLIRVFAVRSLVVIMGTFSHVAVHSNVYTYTFSSASSSTRCVVYYQKTISR